MDWPCINSHFGIVDIAGFPKDAYFYYVAWWGMDPKALFISPRDWTAPVTPGTPKPPHQCRQYSPIPTPSIFISFRHRIECNCLHYSASSGVGGQWKGNLEM